ncbi:protein ACCELERATED CELL DEATH 6 isoform X1 [Brachypodium distachyon]|uniref:PGG domain-containing protein n=1 Tax=Brachypodium distachyon TaxID=15368 RepID=A0A0Q3F2D7_BRADI|nr:protein ACCELERATED CELL DEATH 6 isoform X1 [Brachypodium distachyon]KQJ92668.1 hypothetical protein BRADI_4g45166v3 [Brachypodium distachyon]|eukprot:XP_024310802.1 protein ACCELERATED CELL DEATH 6 isoform X1 [Brachypodium distachyon]
MIPSRKFIDSIVKEGSSSNEDIVEEEGIDQHVLPAAAPLLEGVTIAGDTALHVVASHGDDEQFFKCADIIYNRAKHLLFAKNNKGDTPLHCAVRAGKSRMVSHLIGLATSEDDGQDTDHRKHKLLREVNGLQETALHDAVHIGDEKMVKKLMELDPELANYPKDHGVSPLYLAIFLCMYRITETLHRQSNGNLSYSGPNGQNVLHIAVLRLTGMTKLVLEWNKSLTIQRDGDGSTPLHFVSSLYVPRGWHRRLHLDQTTPWFRFSRRPTLLMSTLIEVFKANPAALCQADNKGLSPIHVAASVGSTSIIEYFLAKCPNSAGLCDAKGRTFLHVAVEKEMLKIVKFVCQTSSLDWILNMQDNDGNTALHLAIQVGNLRIFYTLLGNQKVQLILPNNCWETPYDVSKSKLLHGMGYHMNSEDQIWEALRFVGAAYITLHRDKSNEKYSRLLIPEEIDRESEKVKDATQMFSVGSVLIATVTFGATFALPGGYRADDHTNGGTPTLAGTFAFDAFMMANTLAFICSSIATIGFMFSGTSLVSLNTRQFNLNISVFSMASSVTSMSAAFTLGVYMVLAPVAHKTAVAVCVIVPLGGLYTYEEFLVKLILLARPLCVRNGLFPGMVWIMRQIFGMALHALWPFVVIFGWAAFARTHH